MCSCFCLPEYWVSNKTHLFRLCFILFSDIETNHFEDIFIIFVLTQGTHASRNPK